MLNRYTFITLIVIKAGVLLQVLPNVSTHIPSKHKLKGDLNYYQMF